MGVTCIGVVNALLTVARLGFAPYYLVYSIILIANFRLQQAYGLQIAFLGLALGAVAINEVISALLGCWSAKRHNKAILAIHFILDIIACVIQLGVALRLSSLIVPKYDMQTQIACVTSTDALGHGICQRYLMDDRTAGFRQAWRSYYTEGIGSSLAASRNFQILHRIEDDSQCCGYGPPLRCLEDPRAPPHGLPEYQLFSSFKDHRQMCGNATGWYPESYKCKQPIDATAPVLTYGGCYYDLPVSDCMKRPVSGQFTKGCAANFESYMAQKIDVHARIIMITNAFKYVAILSALILWLRRKQWEGIPKIYTTPDPPSYAIIRLFQGLPGPSSSVAAATASVTGKGGEEAKAGDVA